MLRLQPPSMEAGYFHNFRCGEVFCIGPTTYHVKCALCNQNILYQLFPQHFLLEHLSQAEECKLFNKDGKLVKHGEEVDVVVKAEDDPIGYHGGDSEIVDVDLAHIAMLDIEDEGTVANVELEVFMNKEDKFPSLKQTNKDRKSKVSAAQQKNEDKPKQEESLLVPLLRSSRRRRPICSTSINVTQASVPTPIKKTPTEKPCKKPINAPKTDPFAGNEKDKFPVLNSEETHKYRSIKVSAAQQKNEDKPKQEESLLVPLLRSSRRHRPICSTSTNVTQASVPTPIKTLTEKTCIQPAKVPTMDPFGENDNGNSDSPIPDPFPESDDSWEPETDEQHHKIGEVDDNLNEDNNDNDDDDDNKGDGNKTGLNKRFPCDQCDRSYLARSNLLKHKRLKHNVFAEYDDGRESPDWLPDTDEQHDKINKIDDNEKDDSNHDDDADTNKDDDSKSDAYKTGLEKRFQCDQCSRDYHTRGGLRKHKRVKHDADKIIPQEFKCTICDMVFRYERQLRSHNKIHTDNTCDICGRPFAKSTSIALHRIRHTGIKAFKCDKCDSSFYTKRELNAHNICHTGMTIMCEICGRPCRDHGVLTAHMRRHTGERPAKCDVCGKCFYSFHDLNVHAVAHTSQRPFHCNICGSTFQRKKALRVHKLLHSDKRKHACKICGKAFAQSSGLNSHLRTHDAAAVRAATSDLGNAVKTLVAAGDAGVCSIENVAVADIENAHLHTNADQMDVAENVATGEVTISLTLDAIDIKPWVPH